MNCILQWSLCKEWCPQCKHPFDYLLIHKQLDGTVTDFLTEESVVLLKRARWFEEYMRVGGLCELSAAVDHIQDVIPCKYKCHSFSMLVG